MSGIDNLKVWRTEPFVETWQKFSPDKKNLEWKYPLQSRWFAADIDYPRRYLGTDTIIKELDTKLPFNFSDPTTHKIPITGNNFITYGSKTAAQLAADQKLLKDWFPMYWNQADIVDNLHEDFYDWRKKWVQTLKNPESPGLEIGRYVDNPISGTANQKIFDEAVKNYTNKMTDWEKRALWKMKENKKIPFNEITPPLEEVNKAKINLWESFRQNFRKPTPDHSGSLAQKNIYTPKNRWENISRIPIKVKDIYNRVKMGEKFKSGIPWSTIGQRVINNPFTRTVGGIGNVILGGQALSDVYAGTNMIGNAATNINKWAGSKFKDDGTVDHRLNLKPKLYQKPFSPQDMNIQPAMPPKGAAGFNRGGIVSLVV